VAKKSRGIASLFHRKGRKGLRNVRKGLLLRPLRKHCVLCGKETKVAESFFYIAGLADAATQWAPSWNRSAEATTCAMGNIHARPPRFGVHAFDRRA